jgi:hypothetical protein
MSEACRFEAEVLRAAEENRWTDQLRHHVADCDDCNAAAMVAPWVDQFAKLDDREHILPDPALVYLKARLLSGAVDVSRVSRPMNILQLVSYTVIAAGWAALMTWKWGAIQLWLRGMTPSGIVGGAAGTEASITSLSLSFFALVFMLGSATVMLALHTILNEE